VQQAEPSSSEPIETPVENLTDFSGPLEWYWHFSQRGDFQTDSDQLRALEQLERLHGEMSEFAQYRRNRLNRVVATIAGARKPPRGLYIWGGVGRGKSLMMDAFYGVSIVRRKRRIHFHEFMREMHAELRNFAGQEDPLEAVAVKAARHVRLLCFDEFHVSDIADAMILGRLLEKLIARGVVMVMTSNYRPDDLYPNGLQRERFLPAIGVLNRELDVTELVGDVDHRRRILESLAVYYVPPGHQADASLARVFEAMSKALPSEHGHVSIGGRDMLYLRRTKGVIWFEFAELCAKARSQIDYLEVASHYHTVLLSNIPYLKSAQTDVIRRFTWLVDVFYDQCVKLVISAAAQPEELVLEATESTGPARTVRNEFMRTASRLREMQSKDYFSRKHASAADPHLLESTL
jgi:cell division protein ZapE